MKDGYINIDGYCLGKKCKNMFAFNDMISDMLSNKIRTSTVFMKIPNKRKVQQNATNEYKTRSIEFLKWNSFIYSLIKGI